MCGIAGIVRFDPSASVSKRELAPMLRVLAHRGPDGQGLFCAPSVGLAHCRLAIIDLVAGQQPMANEDASVHVTFNGEIYNYRELHADLAARGHQFRTQSDTEVIVHLYEEFGPAGLARLDGMFAFAVWDQRQRRLLLARDRVGIKPLYYAHTPEGIAFASELKALLLTPGVSRDLDAAALRRYFDFLYLPGANTLFRDVRKLPPGHFLVVEDGQVRLRRYWDLAVQPPYRGTFDEAAHDLRALLDRTVRSHLIADVPVGVLLSGGVDSSTMLALAAQQSAQPVQTFTVGFDDPTVVDERPYARLAARAFGAQHREISFDVEDFWNFLPDYAWHMEEPVCEPPAVALHAVTRLASAHVKVLLSGEGGDEAFAGYPNYVHRLRLARVERLLGPLSRVAGSCAERLGALLPGDGLARYGHALGRPLASTYFSRTSSPVSFFRRQRRTFFAPGWTAGGDAERLIGGLLASHPAALLDQLLYLDTKTWLPDDLLIKADKITMAHSVELRVPLLDHHVLEFAASLPTAFKIAHGESKRVLKAASASVLPRRILQRRKAGFPVPYGAWLRGPLRERVRDTLLSSRSRARGYYQPRAVAQLLEEHDRTGRHGKEIFALLALEFWHQRFVDVPASAAPQLEETLTVRW